MSFLTVLDDKTNVKASGLTLWRLTPNTYFASVKSYQGEDHSLDSNTFFPQNTPFENFWPASPKSNNFQMQHFFECDRSETEGDPYFFYYGLEITFWKSGLKYLFRKSPLPQKKSNCAKLRSSWRKIQQWNGNEQLNKKWIIKYLVGTFFFF